MIPSGSDPCPTSPQDDDSTALQDQSCRSLHPSSGYRGGMSIPQTPSRELKGFRVMGGPLPSNLLRLCFTGRAPQGTGFSRHRSARRVGGDPGRAKEGMGPWTTPEGDLSGPDRRKNNQCHSCSTQGHLSHYSHPPRWGNYSDPGTPGSSLTPRPWPSPSPTFRRTKWWCLPPGPRCRVPRYTNHRPRRSDPNLPTRPGSPTTESTVDLFDKRTKCPHGSPRPRPRPTTRAKRTRSTSNSARWSTTKTASYAQSRS